MIQELTFIEELKKIRSATFKRPVIDETIEKYEKRVSDFESENAPKDKFSTEINQIADSVSLIA